MLFDAIVTTAVRVLMMNSWVMAAAALPLGDASGR